MFSNHSFNALLKTLEEPPPHVKFLLATTDPQKLPVTIRSRCLQFNLKQIPQQMIESYLEQLLTRESIECEGNALMPIARAAEGSMRDALSLLDQAIAFGGGTLRSEEVATMLGTIEQRQLQAIVQALVDEDATELLQQVAQLAEQAADFSAVLVELIAQLHNLALVQMVAGIAQERNIDPEWVTLAEQISAEDLQLYYQIALTGRRDLPLAATPRSGLEMLLLRMLAFKPASAASAVPSTRPAQSAAQPPHSPASQARALLETQTASPQPQPRNTSVEQAAPDTGSATSPSPGTAANQPLNSQDWERCVAALGLGGLAKQLAQHCRLKEHSGSTVHLEIAKKSDGLLNPRCEKQIADALSTYVGSTITLRIEVASEHQLDTPAERAEQRADQARANAEEVIRQDKDFQSLLTTFDGSIVEGSIQPAETP